MFDTLSTLKTGSETYRFFSLEKLEKTGMLATARLPLTIKILLENVLRHAGAGLVTDEDVRALASWSPRKVSNREIPFMPSRVLLQDFTGVPCVADLAAMRAAIKKMGQDPRKINPLIPVDLVIDHSVQVDFFGIPGAFERNVEKEYERNKERYAFLRWAQKALDRFRVVPPGTGICHQVNLEFLASVVTARAHHEERLAFPDTVVGADSHTTMINGLGVLGWGVGGIEAEACMLGQPYFMMIPEVVGFRLYGKLREGATATDLVLTVTHMLRRTGVVGKFVEFFGPGLSGLSLPDRATVANMCPEYGATVGFFPVDEEALAYLRGTNRPQEAVELVEAYTKAQGLFRTDEVPDPEFTQVVELDLESVEPCLAGPKRPQDRISLSGMKTAFESLMTGEMRRERAQGKTAVLEKVKVDLDGREAFLSHGSVVISAITSCTNTSNPSVMVAAGLLAKKAVEAGLSVSPVVKTSLAPGSRVVTDYLNKSGLLPYLEKLGFHLVGYGCTTCIGNSGPLPEPIAQAVKEHGLTVASVLSGNRNFEGRINPLARVNYLGSPPLVVAYALAGRVDLDLEKEPMGTGRDGKPVFLRDLWPTQAEIQQTIRQTLKPDFFRTRYGSVFEGEKRWKSLPEPEAELYPWDPGSTYIAEPPFLQEFSLSAKGVEEIKKARVLALLGDSVTTDHISPAGSIPSESPAARYLKERGVEPRDFNSFGARRGNHEVMVRGTFGNIRIKNFLIPGKEGGITVYFPTGEIMPIYDAAIRYQREKISLLVIAGKEYGAGSSRDWAAKGTLLLGVRAVIAESYERIHRSNLIGMGVLPLQFRSGENAKSLGLTGSEIFDVPEAGPDLSPGREITVYAREPGGKIKEFRVLCRLDSRVEVRYYENGGILPTVLREILGASRA